MKSSKPRKALNFEVQDVDFIYVYPHIGQEDWTYFPLFC